MVCPCKKIIYEIITPIQKEKKKQKRTSANPLEENFPILHNDLINSRLLKNCPRIDSN